MNKDCSKCGQPLKLIPPKSEFGRWEVSKAGKKYQAFYKCDGCGNTVFPPRNEAPRSESKSNDGAKIVALLKSIELILSDILAELMNKNLNDDKTHNPKPEVRDSEF